MQCVQDLIENVRLQGVLEYACVGLRFDLLHDEKHTRNTAWFNTNIARVILTCRLHIVWLFILNIETVFRLGGITKG